MLSRWLFLGLVLAVAAQRLWELTVSRDHEAQLHAAGAIEHAREQMPWMRAVHAGWLLCMLLEVFAADRPFLPALGIAAFAVFAVGQALRLLAMHSLGKRWTVKIITPVSNQPPISGGIYKYLRHPNYLGVVLEIAALPLVHDAYLSALFFSVANGVLLWFRIRAEERALSSTSDYQTRFRERPRFWPALFRR